MGRRRGERDEEGRRRKRLWRRPNKLAKYRRGKPKPTTIMEVRKPITRSVLPIIVCIFVYESASKGMRCVQRTKQNFRISVDEIFSQYLRLSLNESTIIDKKHSCNPCSKYSHYRSDYFILSFL